MKAPRAASDKPQVANGPEDEAMLESRLFREFFEVSPDGIALLDTSDCVLKANPAFLRMFGYTLEEVAGRPINDLIVDETRQEQASVISMRALNCEITRQEAQRMRKDGALVHVEIYGMPVRIGDRLIGIYGIYRDITARRQAEALLAQSEEKYRTIVEAMEDGYFEVDLAGNLTFFNQALPRTLDRRPEELEGLNNREFMDPATARTVFEAFHRVYQTGEFNPGFSWQLRTPDGSTKYLETSVALMRDRSGQPRGFRGILRDATERITAMRALRESQLAFQVMAENTGQLVYDYNLENDSIRWLGAIELVLGLDTDQTRLFSIEDWARQIHPDDRDQCVRVLEQSNLTGTRYHVQYRFRRSDGHYFPVEDIGSYLRDREGRPYRMIGTMADISQRKEQELALFNAKELAEITLNAIGDGVIRIDTDGRVEYLNPSARRLLDMDDKAIDGRPINCFIRLGSDDSTAPTDDLIQKCLAGEKLQLEEGQAWLCCHGGTQRTIDLSASPIRDSDGKTMGAVLAFSDISEQLEIRRQMAYQAEHDALTGLGNRYRFETEANRLIADSTKTGRMHTLLYMDLDQFKIVNDTCGHYAGDQLLCRLSELISEQVRRNDLLVRLGGDEFGLLLADCDTEEALRIAGDIIRVVNQFEFVWDRQNFSVGISIGVVALAGQTDSTSLLKAADRACYAAKDQGRNRFHIYRRDDDELLRRSGQLRAAADVDAAIREDRFELYYQRIVNIQDNEDPGHHEILLRMRGRAGELIGPARFIAGAERYGKMAALDGWVVDKVFATIAGLKAAGMIPANVRYSINLSGATINDPDFHDTIGRKLEKTGIDPANICFEITENSAITHFRSAARFLQRMRTLGCKIMLDDFGSGLSSFTYLKMLPVDYLKIDGSLVRDIANNEFDLAIIRAIQNVAVAFGIPVIAERVETRAVLDKLREIGIEYAQGFYLHRPEPCPKPELGL
jgi:diguanylate cyclase (GGDEF)-like protein/PAS domain S-box-containing protein